jgi:hypothetical protein
MAEQVFENLELTVNPRSGSKVHLELQGTVLTLTGRRGGSDWQLQVPVELVSVSHKRHSKLKQIVTPLGILLACAAVCFGIAFICSFYYKETADVLGLVTVAFVFLAVIAIPFSLLLVIFEKRTQYAYIDVVPMNYHIEFWVSKKSTEEVKRFFESIRARQLQVGESAVPNVFPVSLSDSDYRIFREFIALLYISCLPALFSEKWNLLFLCILPIIWFAWRKWQYLSQPKEYRKAVRGYLKKNAEGALLSLESLLSTQPNYTPALLLMVRIYIEQQQCDKALEVTNKIQECNIDLVRNIQKYIINCKRINQRKLELTTGQN